MLRPLVLPKVGPASRIQTVSSGLHLLATGGLKTGQSPPPPLDELVVFLQSEGWNASEESGVLVVQYNGETYRRAWLYLRTCQFDDLPTGLANDVKEGLQIMGVCP